MARLTFAAIIALTSSTAFAGSDSMEEWHNFYSPDVPYYNTSGTGVFAYAEASTASDVRGVVTPGDGGYIIDCNDTADWCMMYYGGNDRAVWVKMSAFSGVAN